MTKLEKYITILPFAFAIHNIEEALSIDKIHSFEIDVFPYNQAQFTVAVTLFTIFGFILVFGKRLYKNTSSYWYVIVGFAGMLFLNAVVSHIIPSIYFMDYMPGIVSAILLTLPLSCCILWKTYRFHLLSNRQLVITVLSGGGIGMVLVMSFLGIAYLFTM